MTETEVKNGRILAFGSYLTILGALFVIFFNNDKKNQFTAFHNRQALGLWLTYMVIALIIFPLNSMNVYYAFWIFMGVLFIYGMMGALAGKLFEAPILGPLYQKWFKGIGR